MLRQQHCVTIDRRLTSDVTTETTVRNRVRYSNNVWNCQASELNTPYCPALTDVPPLRPDHMGGGSWRAGEDQAVGGGR